VDPVAFNIPHYPRLIKHPMDFGTMLTKLQQGQYKTVKEFESDMRLIFTNCYTFNGFDHVLSQNAKILEQILNKEGPNLRRKEEQLRNAASGSPSSHHTHGHGHKSRYKHIHPTMLLVLLWMLNYLVSPRIMKLSDGPWILVPFVIAT